jgi:hypothetical protein
MSMSHQTEGGANAALLSSSEHKDEVAATTQTVSPVQPRPVREIVSPPPSRVHSKHSGIALDKLRGWIEVSEQVSKHYNDRLRDSPEDVFRADLLDELVQQYDVSGVNLSKQFDRFRNRARSAGFSGGDVDPDAFEDEERNTITYEDFSDGLNSLLPAGAEMLPDTAELVCKLVDRDEDQQITFDEFKEAIVKIKLSLLLNNSFQLLDMDQYENDGEKRPDSDSTSSATTAHTTALSAVVSDDAARKHSPIGLVEFSWDLVQWAFPPTSGNEHKVSDWHAWI